MEIQEEVSLDVMHADIVKVVNSDVDKQNNSMIAMDEFVEELPEDIVCETWLEEIGLTQYKDVLLANFKDRGNILSRIKLAKLKFEHLSSMNITNFDHQKAIIQHLQSTLKVEGSNVQKVGPFFQGLPRKKSVSYLNENRGENRTEAKLDLPPKLPARKISAKIATNEIESNISTPLWNTMDDNVQAMLTYQSKRDFNTSQANLVKSNSRSQSPSQSTNISTASVVHSAKENMRRNSFDNRVWESIGKLRGNDLAKSMALNNLRKGITESSPPPPPLPPRRRWSVSSPNEESNELSSREGHVVDIKESRDTFSSLMKSSSTGSVFGAALTSTKKGAIYGNMAQQVDMAQKDVERLQQDHINRFKDVIGCEVGNILFLNEHSKELLLYQSGYWFRFPCSSGIEGSCAMSGSTVNVADAYSDLRFNKNMDDATGVRTRTILCQPIRTNRGGGRVIGVVRMLNKLSAEGTVTRFDEQDEDVLASCVQRVADDIHIHFQNLVELADKFACIAKLIISAPPLSYPLRRADKSYVDQTLVSALRRHSEGTVTRELLQEHDTEKKKPPISTLSPSVEATDRLMRKLQRRTSYSNHLQTTLSRKTSF